MSLVDKEANLPVANRNTCPHCGKVLTFHVEDPTLSIVIPIYNEAASIPALYSRLMDTLHKTGVSHEIIFVNDGSTDESLQALVEISRIDASVKIIDFSRNFGHEMALAAGLDYAAGEAVIPIDADLQDPPELIVDLVAKWKEGYDVVYATRSERSGETGTKRFTAAFFYRFFGKIASIRIPKDTGNFRLMSRRVVNVVKNLPERHRFMRGLSSWVGFRQTSVYYRRGPRYAGRTKYSYLKMLNFAIEGITSFSYIPLQLASYLGLLVSAAAFLYSIFLIVYKFFYGHMVPGYASIMVVVLFFGGVQMLTMGLLGEYIGRIYDESKHRPLYVVRETFNFDR
jgi:glycosyltransferase involved in cell wall biosynthesis